MQSGSRTVLVLQKFDTPYLDVQYQNTSLTEVFDINSSCVGNLGSPRNLQLAIHGFAVFCSLYHGPQYARAQGISTGLVSYSSAPMALPTLVPRPVSRESGATPHASREEMPLVLCRGSFNGAFPSLTRSGCGRS
jgi:hypothetical protein